MNDFDIQRQWRELEETYAAMSDEELGSLAEKAYDLTDLAKQALAAQLSARNLHVALNEQPPIREGNEDDARERDFDANELDLVSVAQVWDAEEATRIMQTLQNAGVPAYLGPDNVERVSDFRLSFDSGVEIRVRRADDYRAKHALSRDARPLPEGEAVEEKPCVVLCPACNSDEVVFEELVAAASASGSASSEKFRWKCDNCGHEWEDDGIEECTP